jgi:hypothetical protein
MPQGDEDQQIYRRAAEDSLQLLDWCIGYLHGIRKTEISRMLARSRGQIRSNLLSAGPEPDETGDQPLPSDETSET